MRDVSMCSHGRLAGKAEPKSACVGRVRVGACRVDGTGVVRRTFGAAFCFFRSLMLWLIVILKLNSGVGRVEPALLWMIRFIPWRF